MSRLMTGLLTHRRLLLILALFVVGVVVHILVLPPAEGSDEILHYDYVEWLRAENRLPDRAAYQTNCTKQESGQPPLTYIIGAAFLRLLNVPQVDCARALPYFESVLNPWVTPMDGWNRVDNMMTFLRVPALNNASEGQTIERAMRALRLLNIVFGVGSIIGAYGALGEVFQGKEWVLLGTGLFAFIPMMLHLTAYWTNDMSAIVFSSLVIWQTLRLLRLGATPRRLLVLGLLLGLGGLCKVSVMLMLPGVGLAVLLDWRKRGLPFTRLILNGLILGSMITLLFGPWMIFGLTTFQDPVGFRTHEQPKFNYNPPLTLAQTLPMMPEMILTYWGKFGFSKIYLHPVTYTALNGIVLLSGLGYLIAYSRKRFRFRLSDCWTNLRAQQALVLLGITVVVFAGFYNWLRQVYFVTGRLMYPAQVAIVIAIIGGLRLLASHLPRLNRLLRAYTLAVAAAAGLIITPTIIFAAANLPPSLTRDQLPPLRGGPIDFDHTIRFLGYSEDSPVIRGRIHTLNLCWEILKLPSRPGAFSVKFVHDGVILADRTSIHGMGRYNSSLWQPGVIFCDRVDVSIDDPDILVEPQPHIAQVYDVLLVMLDTNTQAVDWQATTPDGQPIQIPIIGQVVTPAGDMRCCIGYNLSDSSVSFPGFADVAGYGLDGRWSPGSKLNIDILWHVTGHTPDGWTQFIHLIGPNSAVTLADGVPMNGQYPTWGWSIGEFIHDRWAVQLPKPLPPGDYTLNIGFYRSDNGARMPVNVDGQAAPNQSAVFFHYKQE